MEAIRYLSPPIPADLRDVVVQWHGYRQVAQMPMRHRALPSTIVPLVFGLTATHTLESTTQRVVAGSFCGGLIETPVSVVTADYHGLQVDLTPAAAARLIGVPAHELAGRLYDVGDLFGSAGAMLAERLATTPGWSERFRAVAGFVRRRLDAAVPSEPDIEAAWALLARTHGTVAIGGLARDIGWSERRLRARFRSHIGVPPKRAARLWRFQHAAGLLTGRPDLSLGWVAREAGFFDQAHLSNEVRSMAGLTASELRSHGTGGIFED